MRTREEIMLQWDAVRQKIAAGCTNSGPRDWFEGVLDDYDALELALYQILGHGNITGERARKIAAEALGEPKLD